MRYPGLGFWLLLRRKRKRGAEKIVEKDFFDFFWIFLFFFWRIHILVEPTGFGSLEREIERDCGERKERKKKWLAQRRI